MSWFWTVDKVEAQGILRGAREGRIGVHDRSGGARNLTLLMLAANQNALDDVMWLVGAGVDIEARDDDGYTALTHAVHNNDALPVVEYLIGAGADVNNEDNGGNVALIDAVALLNFPVVRCLVESGADVNRPPHDGFSVLMGTNFRDSTAIVKYLLMNGADANMLLNVSPVGPVMAIAIAAWGERVQHIVLLLAAGSHLIVPDDE